MNKQIVVFGSSNLDLFFNISDMDFFNKSGFGAQDTLYVSTYKTTSGGKGANQAAAAAKAGANVHFFGAVGQDAYGQIIIKQLKDIGVKTSGIQSINAPTGLAIIFYKPDGKHKSVVSSGVNRMVKSDIVPGYMLNNNTILVLQGETDLKENTKLIKRAKMSEAQIVYNIAPAAPLSPEEFANIDYLILNKPEAEVIAQSQGINGGDLFLFARRMSKQHGLTCIITLGEKGIFAASSNGEKIFELPSLSVEVVDSIGAGDAFVGVFATALSEGLSLKDALHYGIIGGSLACTRVGAQEALPTATEIQKYIDRSPSGH